MACLLSCSPMWHPQIGRIYQAFSGTEGGGTVQNIIEARLPPALPLLPRDLEAGVTLVVEADWEARTARSIALTFRLVGGWSGCTEGGAHDRGRAGVVAPTGGCERP